MGSVCSQKPQDPLAITNKRPSEYKIALLGISECGKSTLFQQFKHLNGSINGLDEREIAIDATKLIRGNCVQSMLILLKNAPKLHSSYNQYSSYPPFRDKNLLNCLINRDQNYTQNFTILERHKQSNFDIDYLDANQLNRLTQLGQAIHYFWNLFAVKETYKFRLMQTYSITDNIHYFFDNILRIMHKDYRPKWNEIMLNCGKRTWSPIEYNFGYSHDSNTTFKIIDIGGRQRVRSHAWISIMNNVSCVVYLCSLNEYCLNIKNEYNYYKNGLLESMQVFNALCQVKYLMNKQFVLVFTKSDLFRHHLKYTSLACLFGNIVYNGANYGIYSHTIHPFMDIVINRYEETYNIMIPKDVCNIIICYFGIENIKDFFWLPKCYNEGIQLITKLFKTIYNTHHKHKKKLILTEMDPRNEKEVQSFMYLLQTKLANDIDKNEFF